MSSSDEGGGGGGDGSSGDERMAFKVTEDDEAFEEAGGFYGGNGRRRRRRTMDDAIYGIFKGSDDDDDDDDDNDGGGARRGGLGAGAGRSRFQKEVAFVTKAAAAASKRAKKAAGSDDDEDDSSAMEEDTEDEDDDEGMRRSSKARGRRSNRLRKADDDDGEDDEDEEDDAMDEEETAAADNDDDDEIAFGEGLQPRRKPVQAPPAAPRPSAIRYATPKPDGPELPVKRAPISREFGKFEKTTKGFGMQMLLKMGYTPGGGLGPRGQGIAEPIEVKQRPKSMGLAYREFDEKTTQAKKTEKLRGKSGKDSEEEEVEAFKEQVASWRADAPGATREGRGKGRRKRKTVDEIREEAAEKDGATAPVKPAGQGMQILDMTGPQTRVVSTTDRRASQRIPQYSTGQHFPELRHNLRLIVDVAETEIQTADRAVRLATQRAEQLREAKTLLEGRIATDRTQAERLRAVVTVVAAWKTQMQQAAAGQAAAGVFDFDAFQDTFTRLQRDYREEYQLYGLGALAVAVVAPVVRTRLADWAPLADPTRDVALFRAWRTLLQTGGVAGAVSAANSSVHAKAGAPAMTPYESMMYNIWLPRIRSAANNDWNPREPDAMVALLESWTDLLPPFLVHNMEEQLILPKLQREVAAWDPRRDPQPIHQWLHPWLPQLGDRMQPLYVGIRHKLTSVLELWHPADPSAHAMLLPWLDVFLPADMEVLLARSILPKLVMALRELVINPANQQMEMFHAVMLWRDLLPPAVMAGLWTNEFFPRWLEVLHMWLSDRPNYDEVTRWYLSWKAHFPADLLEHPAIVMQFNRGLDMMNQAVGDM